VPHWRAIYDDKGRIMVAMCFNMDLGDSWEHADNPQYPAHFSDLGIRIGVNYIVYAMTHLEGWEHELERDGSDSAGPGCGVWARSARTS
jgi:hypothetical protein